MSSPLYTVNVEAGLLARFLLKPSSGTDVTVVPSAHVRKHRHLWVKLLAAPHIYGSFFF